MWKKLGVTLIGFLATFAVIYSMNQSLNATDGVSSDVGQVAFPTASLDIKAGDKVYFGKIVQENEDPTTPEEVYVDFATAIPWHILSDNINGNLYLFSTNSLTTGSISTAANTYSYASSPEKKWLNTAELINKDYLLTQKGFLNAFTPSELGLIKRQSFDNTSCSLAPITNLKNLQGPGLKPNPAADASYAETYECTHNDDEGDYLYPISVSEIYEFHKNGIPLKTFTPSYTPFALNRGGTSGATAYMVPDTTIPYAFWLRSSLNDYNHPSGNYPGGSFRYDNKVWTDGADSSNQGYRPATQVSANSVAYLTASDSDLISTDKQLISSTNNDTYKMTLLNNAMNINWDVSQKTTVKYSNVDKNDITLKFNNARSSGNTSSGKTYLSVFVSDEHGNVVGTGRYLWNNSSSGEIVINPEGLNLPIGNYKLRVSLEQVNHDAKNAKIDSIAYNYASELSSEITLNVFDPHILTYTAMPQNKSTYEYNNNVKASEIIGSLTRSNGTVPIHYELVADGNDSTYQNFEISNLDSDGNSSATSFDVKVKATGATDLNTETNSLKIGEYKFCIESTDANGNPESQILDQSKVCSSFVVYPNENQLIYAQDKNTVTDTFYTKYELNDMASDSKIGSINFTKASPNQSNIDVLNGKGYTIKHIQFVNQGTTTELTEFGSNATSDPYEFDIVKKGGSTFTVGTISFDVLVTWEHDGQEVATLRKSNIKFEVLNGLKYANPEKASDFLSDNTYVYYFDPTKSTNQFTLIATDKDRATQLNTDVTYCIIDENKICTDSSSAISFISGGSAGSQKVSVSDVGPSDRNVNVRAMTKDNFGAIVMKSDLTIIIKPVRQILTWEGTNIQKSDNHIVKDNTKHNTWTLRMKYDKDTAINNEHSFAEIIKGASLSDETITLRDAVIAGITPSITYSIEYSDSSDDGKVIITDDKLTITDELKGDVTIKAKASGVDNYAATCESDDPKTPDINEDERATLILSVSNKPKVSYTSNYIEIPQSTSAYAKGTVGFGILSIDPNTETGYTFTVESVKQLNEKATEEQGKNIYTSLSSDKFYVKDSGSPAKPNLFVKATESAPLSAGTYVVKVNASKAGEEATPLEITIVIADADIDSTKLKWQQRNGDGENFEDVEGNILHNSDTKINQNSEILSKTFAKKADGSEGTFQAQIVNKTDTQLNDATIVYELSKDSDIGFIEVSTSGLVTMKKASAVDTKLYVTAKITKSGFADIEIKLPISIRKGEAKFQFAKRNGTVHSLNDSTGVDKSKYQLQTYTYTVGNLASLDIFTQGAPTGSDVTIKLTYSGAYGKNDILKFAGTGASNNEDTNNPKTCTIKKEDYETKHSSECQTMIENAMYYQTGSNSDKGKLLLSASIEETDNYNAMTIQMPINVTQAENSDFGFAQDDIYIESNTDGSFDPAFKEKDAANVAIGSGKIALLFTPDDDTEPDFTSDEVFFDESQFDDTSTTFLNGYSSFKYNIVVDKDAQERIVHVYAQKEADRNYKASSVKALNVHIAPEGQSRFQVIVKSYPKSGDRALPSITYGDEYFQITASCSDDATDDRATYVYEIDETSNLYMEVYGTNKNEFKPLKAGDKIKVNITRTSGTGVDTKSSSFITIKPKPIKLIIDDISKISGMSVSTDEYKFTDDSGAFLAQDKDKIEIEFSSKDADGKDILTLTDGVREIHNHLPISANIKPINPTDTVLSNYKITMSDGKTLGIEDGELLVTEVESEASWYDVLPGKIDDTTDTVLGINNWYNGPVDIVLKAEAGSFDLIASEDNIDKWNNIKFTVTTEGNNEQKIYFRKSSGDEIGALTKSQSEMLKIDTVKPEVQSIKATLTHTDAWSQLIHAITFGTFMKPGEEVTINTKDVQNNQSIEVSTTNSITDALTYDVYTLDVNGVRDTQIVTKEKLDTNKEGVATFTLDEPGVYEVCAIVQDQATNVSLEKCEKLLVKKIGVDGDGDDIPDYLDPDEDGCPDLDIVLKDIEGKLYKINVDRDKDNIPDLNIDSDGDGIAEINVDSDKDGKPDLNLVILKEWKPTFCVSDQSDEYCTMKGIKAVINVDTGKDGVPDINIDVTGDMKADLNITKEGSEEPYSNITTIRTWKPEVNYIWDEFPYDTDNVHKPHLNIDTDGNGRPDMNLDTDNDGVADLNIDVNGDGEPEINIDSDGDGEADFNIDTGDDGIADENIIVIPKWKPDTPIKDSDFDTMGGLKANDTLIDGDSGIQIQKPGGSFLPNYSIKVDNIKDSIDAKDKGKIEEYIEDDTEIKDIYDVKLSDGTSVIQPDGSIKVRIPVSEDLANTNTVKVVVEQADGSYKEVEATIKDGFIEYETDYLGKVGIIADKVKVEEPEPAPDPDPVKPDVPIPDFKPNGSGGSTPDTSVKGNYTAGIGGAGTGDTTNIMIYVLLCSGSILSMRYVLKKEKKQS